MKSEMDNDDEESKAFDGSKKTDDNTNTNGNINSKKKK